MGTRWPLRLDLDARLDVRRVLAVATVLAVLLGLAVTRIRVPVLSDEYGYLGMGRWLAGEGAHTGTAYDPGLGILYSLVFAVAGSDDLAYRIALGGNAIMLAAAFALTTFALTSRREHPTVKELLAAGVVVSPAFVWYAHAAITETALLLLMSYLFWAYRRSSRPLALSAAALIAGLALLVHTRAAALGVGVVAVATVEWHRNRNPSASWRQLAPYLTGVAFSLFAYRFLVEDHRVRDMVLGAWEPPARQTLLQLLPEAVTVAAWQLAYLVAATAGLVVLGVAASISSLRRGASRWLVFAVTTTIAALFLSGVRLATDPVTSSQLQLVRYVEPFMYPLMALGGRRLLTGGGDRARFEPHGVFVTGLAAGLVCIVTPVWLGSEGSVGGATFGSSVIDLLTAIVPGQHLGAMLLLGTLAIGGCALLTLALLRPRLRPVALVGVIALFAALGYLANLQVLTPRADKRAQHAQVADFLRDAAAAGECVALDGGTVLRHHDYYFRWAYPGEVVDLESDASQDCRWVVTGDVDFGDSNGGARLQYISDATPSYAVWQLG